MLRASPVATRFILGAGCGHSVFCSSGTASGDPCDFISFHRIISLSTACGDSVFCSVVEYLLSSGTASGDPFTYIHTYILHLISSHRFSGHLLWRLSFLFCHMYTTYVHMCVHMYIHIRLGAASGEAFIAFDFMASFLWAPPVATRFSVPS